MHPLERKLSEELMYASLQAALRHEDRSALIFRYKHAFSIMNDREFEFVRDCVLRFNSFQLAAVDHVVEKAVHNFHKNPLGGHHVCFLFATTEWSQRFRTENSSDSFVTTLLISGMDTFFEGELGLVGHQSRGNGDWLDYAVGYVIEAAVTFKNDTIPSSRGHLTWLTQNASALEPHKSELMKRSDMSRGLCESLLANESPALSEGVL